MSTPSPSQEDKSTDEKAISETSDTPTDTDNSSDKLSFGVFVLIALSALVIIAIIIVIIIIISSRKKKDGMSKFE
jgi:hypothetical protein